MTLRAVIWAAVSTNPQATDDKDSLPRQESDGLALSDHNAWKVVDTLRVPGHSRRYVDIHECAQDMAKQGIEAFQRLLRLWEIRGFDVLIVRDASRFARTQALHAYVVERTIDIDARIYSLADGWIDAQNYRMWIALGGFSSAGEIDRLVKYREMGLDRRAERGFPSSHVPFPHVLIRDERGKPIRLEVDETRRRLLDDLAALILEGAEWLSIERALYTRFGHVNPETGKAYTPGLFYSRVMSPFWWGNASRYHRKRKPGPWIFDAASPTPPKVVVHYGTHPAVWTGDEAVRIQAELIRRFGIRGRAKPNNSYKFTGLLVCAGCGHRMVVRPKRHRKGGGIYVYWGCAMDPRIYGRRCEQRKYVRDHVIQEWVNALLQTMIDQGATDALNQRANGPQPVDQLEREIAQARKRLSNLIESQANEEAYEVRRAYSDKIREVNEQIEILKARLQQIEHSSVSPAIARDRAVALEEIKTLGLEHFWTLPDTKINQSLHRIFRRLHILVRDGQPVDVVSKE